MVTRKEGIIVVYIEGGYKYYGGGDRGLPLFPFTFGFM